jgi:hypothetical protein
VRAELNEMNGTQDNGFALVPLLRHIFALGLWIAIGVGFYFCWPTITRYSCPQLPAVWALGVLLALRRTLAAKPVR